MILDAVLLESDMTYKLLLFAVFTSSMLMAEKPAWQPDPGHVTLNLWPNGAPGAAPNTEPEIDINKSNDDLIAGRKIVKLANVSTPTLTLYAPAGKNTGAAIVVFPGGGYSILAIDLEGTEVCDWLTSAGVSCILVKYRVPESGPYPKFSGALQDAQRAVGLVRAHAEEWHIDPAKIGVLGFSAGGHLAAAVSTHFDKRVYEPIDLADQQSSRPDFTVLVYPAYLVVKGTLTLSSDIPVTAETPPAFLVQAEDDTAAPVENSLVYFHALKKAKVNGELHVYSQGGHGFGLRHTDLAVTGWPRLVEAWLRTIKVLPLAP
jgi:acetyl esterase/lipase